ncbi:hypothetical protein PENTCL1PPCAC_29418, partial [Pristionchus entomophagus]
RYSSDRYSERNRSSTSYGSSSRLLYRPFFFSGSSIAGRLLITRSFFEGIISYLQFSNRFKCVMIIEVP